MAKLHYSGKSGTSSGVMTPEEAAHLTFAWTNFAAAMADTPEGADEEFEGVICEWSDLQELTSTFNGETKKFQGYIVKFECTEPGMEGLRWRMDVPDKDHYKAKQIAVLLAVRAPITKNGDYYDISEVDTDEHVIGKPVIGVIRKGKPRPDGKRGGFASYLKTIKAPKRQRRPVVAIPVATEDEEPDYAQ